MIWRRRVVTVFALGLLLALTVFGCEGVGEPTFAGTHRFQRYLDGGGLEVIDPPQLGAILLTGSPDAAVGQFSPDGQWLYVMFHAPVLSSLAGIRATRLGDVLVVNLRLRGECFMECTESGFLATRVALRPAIDSQRPPAVVLDCMPLEMEPKIP